MGHAVELAQRLEAGHGLGRPQAPGGAPALQLRVEPREVPRGKHPACRQQPGAEVLEPLLGPDRAAAALERWWDLRAIADLPAAIALLDKA